MQRLVTASRPAKAILLNLGIQTFSLPNIIKAACIWINYLLQFLIYLLAVTRISVIDSENVRKPMLIPYFTKNV